MYAPGIRVVRGPDWIWQNQDDGEGHVGTVCEIGRFGSAQSPEKTVVVNWDSGHRTNYRVGYQGQFDLIIVDNAQVGVKHQNIICDGCTKDGIAGIRFRCAQCTNYDLCATCYGSDLHDLEHAFVRYQTSTSVGVRVTARSTATKIQLKGIFVGSKVVRGPDWEWGAQDGGEGKTGRCMEIRGWANESCRSVANVTWITGSTNVYRLGHKGNVDLKYLQAATGGYYYREHMPVLGQPDEQQAMAPLLQAPFSVGDRVKVCLEKEALMKLQQGHGGWNPRMAEFLGHTGNVHRITDKGDIRVQYDGCSNRWTFHPSALIKVCTFHVGDIITIIQDAAKVQQLQRGHGEWVDTMKNALGKTAKVIKVYGDGDVRVQQMDEGFAWTLNPKCVQLERSPILVGGVVSATERSNSMMDLSNQRTNDHVIMPLSGLSGSSAADKLVREAAQGRFEYVQQYLEANRDQIDVMSAGKTCLQVASHQGHSKIVTYLLSVGARVNVVDKEGDSTLHYSAFGNQPEIMRLLLQNGAEINVLNASHCSALHISAHKKPPHCVRILLEYGADVNIQDSYGDTALHDAIGKENSEVIDLLCNAPNLDLNVRNNRGFNALHHASLKGNVHAASRIIQLSQPLVDAKKDDGFSALHLAALNGHASVCDVLIRDGMADINIRNNRKQTPFLLAVSQGHAAAIEKLIDLGCDILAQDEDGDNAMHLCVIKKSNFTHAITEKQAPKIWEIYKSLQNYDYRLMLTMLCYLAKNGCQMEANAKGKVIFDWLWDKEMQEIILSYFNKSTSNNIVNRLMLSDRNNNNNNNNEIGGSSSSNANINIVNNNNNNNNNNGNHNDIDLQIYSNMESLNTIGNNSIDNNSNEQSNPPTPLRRGNNQQQQQPQSVDHQPSSSNQFTQRNDGELDTNVMPKKLTNINRIHTPPQLPPTSSSSLPHVPPTPPPHHPSSSSSSTSASLHPSTQQVEQQANDNDNQNENENTNLSTIRNNINNDISNFNNNNNNNNNGLNRKEQNTNTPSASSSSASSSSAATPAAILSSISSGLANMKLSNITNDQPQTPPTLHYQLKKSQDILECIVCNELLQLTIFVPCHHKIACEECSIRMKKCLSCGTFIEKRVTLNGRDTTGSSAQLHSGGSSLSSTPIATTTTAGAAGAVAGSSTLASASSSPLTSATGFINNNNNSIQQMNNSQQRQPSVDRLRYLESKILEIEETHCCSICMERRRNVAFLCGHGACSKCAETLKTCHMCRKNIVKKINLY